MNELKQVINMMSGEEIAVAVGFILILSGVMMVAMDLFFYGVQVIRDRIRK